AERLFDSAYIVYDQIGDVKGKCSILLYQGANEINKGRFDAAADKYFASLKLASENNQNLSKGDAYNYLSEYYYLVAEYDSSFQVIDSSIHLYRENNNSWGLASASLTKGNTYNLIGDYKNTTLFYLKSDSIYQLLESEPNRATIMNNLGTVFFFQGEYNEALRQFKQTLEILEKTRAEINLKGTAMSNIGEIYIEQ